MLYNETNQKEEVEYMDSKTAKIGFIGFGNMGQAMAQGWINEGDLEPSRFSASARNFEKLKENCSQLGVQPFETSAEVVEHSDILVLAVKPYQIKDLVEPLKEALHDKIIISVAAGYAYKMLKELFLEGTSLISTIPNTPVSIGEGIVVAEQNHSLSLEEEKIVTALLEKLGVVEFIETDQLSIAGTLAGCGPAFASMFIEALADGAVKYGLPRKEAYRLASQMLAGTGKLQLETDQHPGAMKDAVTSPGGTTIKGVAALEENGFRNAVIQALDAIEG